METYSKIELAELFDAIDALIISEDSTGCSGDLTVISKEAFDKLREAFYKLSPTI